MYKIATPIEGFEITELAVECDKNGYELIFSSFARAFNFIKENINDKDTIGNNGVYIIKEES